MNRLRQMATGMRALLRKKRADAELDEVVRGYLEMALEQKMKQGMSPQEAVRAGRLERGSAPRLREKKSLQRAGKRLWRHRGRTYGSARAR